MTVLHLISSGGGFYGAERVLVTLGEELQDLGVRVIVAAFRTAGKAIHLEVLDQAKAVGLLTKQINCKGRLDRKAVADIRQIIFENGVDIIHSHGIKSDLYAVLAARKTPVRLVGTCHSWTIDSMKGWLVSALDCLLLRRLDAVVIVSGSLRKRLRRWGVASEKIHLVHNGINLTPFASAIRIADGRSIGTQELVVGTVSRLVPVKGLRFLLDAAAIVLREFPLAKFVLVGDGPDLEPLRQHAAYLNIENKVYFAGKQTNMTEVYSSFDVFILPSLSEAMPMALMEAMAAGLPVIASAVGEIPDMILNNENGLLAEPGSAPSIVKCLLHLLNDFDAQSALGGSAQMTARKRFSARAMAIQYLSLYKAVKCRRETATTASVIR